MSAEDTHQELQKIARDLSRLRPQLRAVASWSRRASAEDAVVKALRSYLAALPDYTPAKESDAIRAFGQTLQPKDFWGTKHAPFKINYAHATTSGSVQDGDAKVSLELVFHVRLDEAINRAITIATPGKNTLHPGAHLPAALATATAKWIGERADLELKRNRKFFQSLLQRDSALVHLLKEDLGTSNLEVLSLEDFEVDPSGGLFGMEAMIKVAVTAALDSRT